MIICFSGTGNSRRMANRLQNILGDELLRLPPGLMNNPSKAVIEVPDGRLIWVMPVHSWGIPKVPKQVIRLSQFKFEVPTKHYLVFTCGDDIGLADKQWREALKKRGFQTAGAFTVQMPNYFTFMPGFDVDSPELAKAKLDAAEDRIEQIAEWIDDEQTMSDVTRGKWAWIKTRIIHPWFMAYKTSTKPFWTNDNCVGCGLCAKSCPLMSITMVDNVPKWSERCTMCARCYHVCPHHAVEYGNDTRNKGQYLCPGYSIARN